MGDGAAYNHLSMEQAVADSGLEPHEVSNERTGIIMGSGGSSTRNLLIDPETAKMALQAAMSGDRVYTTLQTKDCFGALPRLFDLGLAPGMLAGNITALIAQRLVRCLCPECREACTPEPAERKILQEGIKGQEIEIDKVFRARQGGCDQCGGQGYKGRTCIAETLLFDEDRSAVRLRSTRCEVHEACHRRKMRPKTARPVSGLFGFEQACRAGH